MLSLPTHRDRLVLCASLLWGCTPEGPIPELRGVQPEWGYSGAETAIEITGEWFLPRVEAAGANELTIDNRYSLVLESTPPTPLTRVTRQSDTLLTATVPAGVPPGRYPLRVTSPSGASSTLDEAFTVTATRASTVGISIPELRFDVGDQALATIQLRDPSGGDVPAAIEVEVQARPLSGDPAAVFFQEGLVDQEFLEAGRIRGSLDSGGGASLYFTSTTVDDVALQIRGLGLNEHIDVVSTQVRFEPAEIKDVEIIVESAPIVAGVPTEVLFRLLDADGNPTRGELLVATIQETCSPSSAGLVEVVTINDQLQRSDIVFTGATVDGGCSDNRLRLVGTVGSNVLVVETPPLEILAGEPARYSVSPVVAEVTAGTDVQSVLVRAEDNWGNPVVDHDGRLTLYDNLGGLDPESGAGSASCGAFFNGQVICTAVLDRTGDAVTITTEDDVGLTGTSREFRVLAGPADSIEVDIPSNTVEAGASIQVMTQAVDALGNPASFDDVGGAGALRLADTTGTLSCSARFDGPADGLHYSYCAMSMAHPENIISANIDALGVSGSADPIEVTNGPLDHVEISIGSTNLTAGDPLTFSIVALDEFDNPYRVQATTSLVVADREGRLTPTDIALDAVGTGTGVVVPVHATESNAVVASVGSVPLGESVPFVVSAAEPSAFEVDVGSTWVDLADTVPIEIKAVDAYGNPSTAVNSQVTVAVASELAPSQSEVPMVDGVAETHLTWSDAILEDVVTASDDSLAGTSAPVDVLDFLCAAPPVASVTVASETDLRLCLVAGQTSDVTISASASSAEGAPLAAYHRQTGSGLYARDTSATWTERWSGEGARTVTVVVADEDACADSAEARVWVGDSDGSPVGPVEVSLDDATLTSGSSSSGSTAVQFSAYDCAGDPSNAGTLYVRADLGDLTSGTSVLRSTGAGLSMVLDSQGQGDLNWSMSAVDVAGTATLHAGVLSGAAYGGAEAEVSGDARSPIAVQVSPSGPTLASWSTIQFEFSEPLLATSVVPEAFSLTSPAGDDIPIDAVSLSSDGTRVTVEPRTALDGSQGAWTVSAGSTLRDDAGGNPLSGDWLSVPSDLVLEVGDVTSTAPPVVACTPSSGIIRPDGDDGPGSDADSVELSVSATAMPTWWWLEVTDEDAAAILWQPTTATGSTQTLAWDGRGMDGFIVAPGSYTLTVSALDGQLSDNTACTAQVRIDQQVRSPESQ